MRLSEALKHKDGYIRRAGWPAARHVSLNNKVPEVWEPTVREWGRWLPTITDHNSDSWEWSSKPPPLAR